MGALIQQQVEILFLDFPDFPEFMCAIFVISCKVGVAIVAFHHSDTSAAVAGSDNDLISLSEFDDVVFGTFVRRRCVVV